MVALVRNKQSDRAKAVEALGAELAEGDFEDVQSLEKALQGVYGVFSMQDFRKGVKREVKQGKAIADIARKVGVKHFVYSSVGSANRFTGIPHFESKYQIEQHIQKIGLPYTILRPVFFMYNYHGMRDMIKAGILQMPLSPEKKVQQLSEDDYEKMVAAVFADRKRFLGKKIEVASVEVSMYQLAQTFSRVLSKPVEYQSISFNDFQKTAGDETTIMFRWFEYSGYSANLRELEHVFFPLTLTEDYLKKHWRKS